MGTSKEEGLSATADLKALAEQKEREWKEVQQLRIQSLEAALAEKENLLIEERSKFQKLKEDFKYNLRLLGERDAELDKYDSSHAGLQQQLSTRDAKVSELHIQVDELQGAVRREEVARHEQQTHYQQRLRERQAELDQYRRSKDAEIQKEREEMESFRRNLERQLHEVEEELQLQKQELTVGYEDAMQKREHEWRTQADEMSTKVLAHDLKVKLLTKELEQARQAEQTGQQQVDQVHGDQQKLRKQIQQLQWQIEDTTAMKNAKIKELEEKIKQMELNTQREKEYFQRKMSELDRHGKEQESALERHKSAGHERENELQGEVHSQQDKLQQLEMTLRQEQWKSQDAVRAHQDHIERLESELSDVKSRWESHISSTSKSTVARDVELQAVKEDQEKIKAELQQRKQDIDRYKRELSAAVDREEELERSKAQLELDWQRRYESVERTQYQKAEDLIRNLNTSRDQALATVKEKERELGHKSDLLGLLTKERDQALLTLKQHGLIVDRTIEPAKEEVVLSESDEVMELQKQNDNLREVVRHMRQQMEALGDQVPESDVTIRHSATEEYIKNLEAEVKVQKTKYRLLQQQQAHVTDTLREDQSNIKVTEVIKNNPLVQTHVEQLNITIGDLRKEKVELSAQLMKQQARIQHLEVSVDSMAKQPREQQVKLEQLHYELGAAERRHLVEASSLQQRAEDLQLQLEETRKEASEYHKGSLEANSHLTSLQQQMSALKMEIAQGRTSVNYGAQELLIQQLQGEIGRLQRKQQGKDTLTDGLDPLGSSGTGQSIYVSGGKASVQATLENKLRLAAKHIKQLALEKQQLIEVGNRLRAELNKNGIRPHSPPRVSAPVPVKPEPAGQSLLQQTIHSKLQQLEQLQYDLTKQELARGPKHQPRLVPPIELDTSSADSEMPEEDQNLRSILKKPAYRDSLKDERLTAEIPELMASTEGSMSRSQTAQSVRDGQVPLLMSMSSFGGESLQDIWKMLDDGGITPRPDTPLEVPVELYSGHLSGMVPDPRPDSANSWTLKVRGAKIEPRSDSQTDRPLDSKAKKSGVTSTMKRNRSKVKVRNYNVKEDISAKR